MNAEQWNLIGDLFPRALELEGEERREFLERETGGDTRLISEVASLLRAHEGAGSVLEKPLAEAVLKGTPRVEGFRILRELGAGSLATVYLAEDLALGRKVALKVSSHSGDESRSLARLDHPNVVKIFSETGRAIVMQYVPGGTLSELIALHREGAGPQFLDLLNRLSAEDVPFDPEALRERERLAGADFTRGLLRITLQLLDALEHAHRQGILHLDIKPANILITPYGRAYLADFNVAVAASSERSVGGTREYMAPEQAEGGRVDARADLFAIGRVLERAQASGADEIIARCTSPAPDQRYTSAAELRAAIQNHLDLEAASARLPEPGPLHSWGARHPFSALIFSALVPQLLGSIANTAYGALRVAPGLSPAQQIAFWQATAVMNVLAYGLGVLAFVLLLNPLRHGKGESRAHVLSVPKLIWLCASSGWLPALVIFPRVIALMSDGEQVPLEGQVAFGVGFVLAWLISTSFGLMLSQSLIVRAIYPRLLRGTLPVGITARRELSFIARGNRLLPSLAGLVPLIGAGLAVLTSADSFTPETFRAFRILVALLIGLGIAGMLLAMRMSATADQAIETLGRE